MDTLKIVNCPCCKSVLYTLTPHVSNGKPTWRLSKDSPTIRKDGEGSFMKCGRCGKRIGLVGDAQQSSGFRLAPGQNCG
jgi:hypothetical protein